MFRVLTLTFYNSIIYIRTPGASSRYIRYVRLRSRYEAIPVFYRRQLNELLTVSDAITSGNSNNTTFTA